jgi:hypothetical protein
MVIFYPLDCYASGIIARVGDVTRIALPAYGFGMTMREENLEGSKQFLYSFSATYLTIYGLKPVVRERTPDGVSRDSFPSGHSADFQAAAFIHMRYGWKQAIVPYVVAAYTGYSRVQAKKHYVHDIMASWAIGGVYAWLFTSEYEESEGAKKTEGTASLKSLLKNFQVTGDTKSLGIGFATRF